MNDLISRHAAIAAMWKALYDYEDKMEKQFQESDELDVDEWMTHRIFVQNMNDIDKRAISELPPAQQWIPVSERFPDEDASVLASIKNHSFEVVVGEIDGEVFWIVDGFIPLDDVIAWMPLPEQYEEEEK